MAEVNPPLFLGVQQTYQAADLARPFQDILGEGVIGVSDLAVTQRAAGANMSVDVAAGVAWVKGDTATDQPAYRVRNDAAVNLTVSTANATNPRIDVVVAEVLDAAFTGSSNLWRLRVITGTAAASPAVPTIPATAMPLAQIAVAANATSVVTANISDLRQPASRDISATGHVSMFPAAVPFGFVALATIAKRLRYPRLFAYLGTTYNTGGEAADEFRTGPVMVDRFPVAAGSAYALAATGGAATVTLTAAQSGLKDHAHLGPGGGAQYLFGTGSFGVSGSGANGSTPYNVADEVLTGGVSGGEIPASASHENRPPYIALNFAIRA